MGPRLNLQFLFTFYFIAHHVCPSCRNATCKMHALDIRDRCTSSVHYSVHVTCLYATFYEPNNLCVMESTDYDVLLRACRIIQRVKRGQISIDLNCVDPLGRGALLMAIDNENLLVQSRVVMVINKWRWTASLSFLDGGIARCVGCCYARRFIACHWQGIRGRQVWKNSIRNRSWVFQLFLLLRSRGAAPGAWRTHPQGRRALRKFLLMRITQSTWKGFPISTTRSSWGII